ncbi:MULTISPECIES: TetR/AcrR family transcriptional regulator [unclassified Saccharopolyspora]|uniref:TetR/AcrR family transcriptional regulator n=1 Tax=unclassified Saccharopolyspora TaxID=2646250 RepID=UPI001CD363FA|nr:MULTISPECIES: TetR/AcrR family transcriptional regulator [unclassified Saccharopolyspora]MCA1188305.1 TetR/AcrR family transcriptional regulator [Saccharopolyspora sp. 6T]MCA1193485.1 TetR/AcrR family transcriptional regulator [Saccharopolyspora sp. 6V]MCA1229495.1 TetR/AcrR family transcriptional regulator [Saccharopolyspora sp. 6M]MCA1280520.1 TetR/AcrR family transcriptional regulator [Saccharopolyspora sp. 7B]
MAARTRRPMRREPSQERSRAMVRRILDAGYEVLLEHGYDRASTGRIAAAAGISPGSLYQYFPDKHVLLGEVVDRCADRLRTRISRAFVANLAGGSLPDAVRGNVLALITAFEENAGLLRVLYEQLPPNADTRRADFKHRIDELVTTALLGYLPGGARADAVAWVLVRTVENLAISYVLDPPEVDREDAVEEITALLTGYLATRLDPERR